MSTILLDHTKSSTISPRDEFLRILCRAAGSPRPRYGEREIWLRRALMNFGRGFTLKRLESLYKDRRCVPSVGEMDAARAWAARQDAANANRAPFAGHIALTAGTRHAEEVRQLKQEMRDLSERMAAISRLLMELED